MLCLTASHRRLLLKLPPSHPLNSSFFHALSAARSLLLPLQWVDARGNWHALTHNQGVGNLCGSSDAGHSCGAHLFSRDSYSWGISLGGSAYGSAVRLMSNRSVVNTQTRQRPQLVFSDDVQKRPLFLFNGVSFEGNNGDLNMLTHTLAFEFNDKSN